MRSRQIESKLSLLDYLERYGARSIMRLPAAVKIRLSGRPRVVVDGLALDPDMQILLALRSLVRRQPVNAYEPVEARARILREAIVHRGTPVKVRHVRDLLVDGGSGSLRARHYAPNEEGSRPLLVFFHGGGFVVGDLETHDEACRMLCRHAGVHVLSVAYRLAPEAPFPAAVDDALAAFAWARKNAGELGADRSCVGVGGDSAGGNLAAVVTQKLAHDDDVEPPTMQLLIYPSIDRTTEWRSLSLFADGFFLSRAELDDYVGAYTAGADLRDARNSLLRAESLRGLPPALVVTAGFDPLRDEGEAYVKALADAGCVVVGRRMEGLIHGFINMAGVSPACRDALVEIAGATRAMFASAPQTGA